MLKQLISRWPLGGVISEALLEAVYHHGWSSFRKLDLMIGICYCLKLAEQVLVVAERWIAVDKVVKDAAKGPNVRFGIILDNGLVLCSGPIGQCFGRHVVDRPDLVVLDDAGRLWSKCVGNSKVYQLQLASHGDKVDWLQIGVHNAVRVDLTDGSKHFFPVKLDHVLIELIVFCVHERLEHVCG